MSGGARLITYLPRIHLPKRVDAQWRDACSRVEKLLEEDPDFKGKLEEGLLAIERTGVRDETGEELCDVTVYAPPKWTELEEDLTFCFASNGGVVGPCIDIDVDGDVYVAENLESLKKMFIERWDAEDVVLEKRSEKVVQGYSKLEWWE